MADDEPTVIYTARATVTGGRDAGHGRTHDGAFEVRLRRPREAGGEGGGANPEQLFAIGYAACFESALGMSARRAGLDASDASIDAQVSLVRAAADRFELAVALDVTLPSVEDPAQAVEAVRAAHRLCPYSNAIRSNVDVALTANGRPVSA